ncbi:MAG TPA: phosphodiester glycosidase family protein [Pyrinomonadaceae bacterium]|nr:phosphodiester glycosidase family protein [Pyrinomonadaceae bacterium]
MKNIQLHSLSYRFIYFRYLAFLLYGLCVLCGEIHAQDFKTVSDGIDYAEVTREISGQQVKMNLLRLDLTKVRLDVVHAMDAAIGTEKTSSIATRHGAFAAINAGFFRLDNSIFAGDPVGLLMIDGRLISESTNNRVAIGIWNRKNITEVAFGHSTIGWAVTIGGKFFEVSGVNRQRKENELIVYQPNFHRTTLTSRDGIEIVVRKGRITRILRNQGSTVIPDNGFVLSASGKMQDTLSRDRRIRLGAKVSERITTTVTSHATERLPFVDGPEDAVAGVPQLIKNGNVDVTWQEERSSKSFVETRHPRTAVAKLKDGKFLMITVDGRSESSGGIGLYDLANYLLELGAVDAMNLDGGGSTTMFLDGKVVNHPSDKEGERKISDAILVFPRRK